MRSVAEVGMPRAVEVALAAMDPRTHLHVSFDLDFVDQELAPGVGTPVPAAPNLREVRLCMEMLADSGHLGSLGVVEIDPALDMRNRTAELAVDLIVSLFGASTLMRAPRRSSHGRRG